MKTRFFLAAGLALSIVACASSSEPVSPGTTLTTYDLSVTGDTRASAHGFTFTTRLPNGYTELNDRGELQSTNVVVILFASTDVSQPQLSLGLIGPLQPGTYRIRAFGSALGVKQEFYGTYMVRADDGSRRSYPAAEGTVTITSVSPTIQGTFSFHANRVLAIPADIAPGTTLIASQASLDATGTFGAQIP